MLFGGALRGLFHGEAERLDAVVPNDQAGMGRILHRHACTPSVVIEEAGVESGALLENIERPGRFGGGERGEKTLSFAAQRRVDPARIAAFAEPFEAAMPKAPDHNRLQRGGGAALKRRAG